MIHDRLHVTPTPLGEALLTADVVAAFLGISRSTVFRMAAAGELPVVAIGSRTKRFRIADLHAYVERRTQRATPRDRVKRLLG